MKNGQPFDPADCLAKKGGSPQSCAIKRSDVLSDRNQTLDFVTQFPLLKVLDMSDAICRADVCRPVEGNVLIYHGAHHLTPPTFRTMAGRWAARSPPTPVGGERARPWPRLKSRGADRQSRFSNRRYK